MDDDVYKWVNDRQHMVVPIDERIQSVVKQILAAHRKLVDTHKNRHLADPFVIALAHLENGAVVSGEVRSPNLAKNPRIPDVCENMGIPHVRFVDMLRNQGWTF